MNTADKARLEELKVRVYSKYAVKCLEKETDLTIIDSEIERKGNRVGKADKDASGSKHNKACPKRYNYQVL